MWIFAHSAALHSTLFTLKKKNKRKTEVVLLIVSCAVQLGI